MAVGAQNKRTSFRMSFCFVLSAKYRCRTRPGPRTAGRRFCAVQAFCRRQNLGAGAIHLPRAFEISQDSIKITTPNGVVIFMEHRNTIDAKRTLLIYCIAFQVDSRDIAIIPANYHFQGRESVCIIAESFRRKLL